MPEEIPSSEDTLRTRITRLEEAMLAHFRALNDSLSALREDLGLPRQTFAQLYADMDKLRIGRDELLREVERLSAAQTPDRGSRATPAGGAAASRG